MEITCQIILMSVVAISGLESAQGRPLCRVFQKICAAGALLLVVLLLAVAAK